MRLIDADKLKREEIVSFEYGTFKPTDGEIIDGKTIDNAPTIKAITIEWIMKFRDQFELDDEYYKLVDGLLNIWEKENEKDI